MYVGTYISVCMCKIVSSMLHLTKFTIKMREIEICIFKFYDFTFKRPVTKGPTYDDYKCSLILGGNVRLT